MTAAFVGLLVGFVGLLVGGFVGLLVGLFVLLRRASLNVLGGILLRRLPHNNPSPNCAEFMFESAPTASYEGCEALTDSGSPEFVCEALIDSGSPDLVCEATGSVISAPPCDFNASRASSL